MLEHSSREGMRVRPGASAPSLSSDPSVSRPSDPGAPALPRRPSALGSAPRRLGGLQGRLPGSLRGVEDADLKPSGNRCQSRCGLSHKGRARWREGGRTRHAARSEALEAAGGPLRSHVFLGNLGKKMQQKKGGQKGSEGPALGREAPHPTPHRRELGVGIGSKGGDSPGAGHGGCHHGKGQPRHCPTLGMLGGQQPAQAQGRDLLRHVFGSHRVARCTTGIAGHREVSEASQTPGHIHHYLQSPARSPRPGLCERRTGRRRARPPAGRRACQGLVCAAAHAGAGAGLRSACDHRL